MESKEMVYRSVRKDEMKLRMVHSTLNDMKEDFNKNLREIKKIVEDIRLRFHISYVYNYAFEVIFGANPGDNSDAKREKQAKEKCIVQFKLLYTHLEFLSGIDSENTCSSGGFQWAFRLFFREEVKYFAPSMVFLDKLKKQLNNKEFDEEVSMVVFEVFRNQFQQFTTKRISIDYNDSLANIFFTAYILCDAQMFKNILISQIDSVEKAITEIRLHKKAHDSKVNKRTMQTQVGMVNMVKDKCDVVLVVTEISRTKLEKQDESSRSKNDTQDEGANIRLSNDTKPLNEVQSTATYNVFSNDRQHGEQPNFINERKVDQDAE
nr:hypothetical protein [Tanacetum cinerariifolium]